MIISVVEVLVGLFCLAMPPASSSALVKALDQAPPDQRFEMAYHFLSSIFWCTGLLQIAFGTTAIICYYFAKPARRES